MSPEPVGSTHLRFGDARVVGICICSHPVRSVYSVYMVRFIRFFGLYGINTSVNTV